MCFPSGTPLQPLGPVAGTQKDKFPFGREGSPLLLSNVDSSSPFVNTSHHSPISPITANSRHQDGKNNPEQKTEQPI